MQKVEYNEKIGEVIYKVIATLENQILKINARSEKQDINYQVTLLDCVRLDLTSDTFRFKTLKFLSSHITK